MNKYQEALYSIKRKKNFDPEYGEYTFNIFGDDDEDIEAIEELVNKTIPIKPTEYKPKFCQECGREFDWSKDE